MNAVNAPSFELTPLENQLVDLVAKVQGIMEEDPLLGPLAQKVPAWTPYQQGCLTIWDLVDAVGEAAVEVHCQRGESQAPLTALKRLAARVDDLIHANPDLSALARKCPSFIPSQRGESSVWVTIDEMMTLAMTQA
jgi:hypothetical protein